MRIDSYQIGMDSERLYKSSYSAKIRLAEEHISGQGSDDPLMSFAQTLGGKENKEAKKEAKSDDSKEKVKEMEPEAVKAAYGRLNSKRLENMDKVVRSAQNEFQKLRQMMIRHIFELLFGGRSNSKSFNEELVEAEQAEANEPNIIPTDFAAGSFDDFSSYELITTEYSSSGCFTESEHTSFQALGQVKTADGRSIDINLNISMSRSFSAFYEKNYSTTRLQVIDPLVINFDGNPAGLEKDMDFFFDLDCDGEEEKIAKLTAGSAFLALDLNDDGVINDGSELFGTKSGDGFADLAAYDEDGNGWIDENDSIFTKLKMWTRDENGNDILYTLKEKDIGALYLGAVDTQFSLTDDYDQARGYVRQTGLFLYENGMAGSMQHIDLVS